VDVARHQRLSNAGAGAVGAAVTLAVVVVMFGVLAFLGMLTVGRPRSKRTPKA